MGASLPSLPPAGVASTIGEKAAGAAGPGATVAVAAVGGPALYIAAYDDATVYDPGPDAAAGLGVGFTAVLRLLATSPSRLHAVTGVGVVAAGAVTTGAEGATAGATAGAAKRI